MGKCGIKRLHTKLKGNDRPETLKCPPMTRRQIIERALGWVLLGTNYMNSNGGMETCASDDPNPNCPEYGFQLVCNGFLDMAWYGGGSDCQDRVWCGDLKPGDKIKVGSNHQVMFREYTDDGPSKESGCRTMAKYQMGGGWSKAMAGPGKVCWKGTDPSGGHCF